jgi:hypothetical protein
MTTASNTLPNGPGAAALLSAGLGSFALGIVSLIADKSAPFKSALNFYRPSGPLSGETTLAVAVWIVSWIALAALWRRRNVSLKPIVAATFVLLVAALLLTFPPFADLL